MKKEPHLAKVRIMDLRGLGTPVGILSSVCERDRSMISTGWSFPVKKKMLTANQHKNIFGNKGYMRKKSPKKWCAIKCATRGNQARSGKRT